MQIVFTNKGYAICLIAANVAMINCHQFIISLTIPYGMLYNAIYTLCKQGGIL